LIERTYKIGNDRKRWQQVLALLAAFTLGEEDDYELVLRPAKYTRSIAQNRRYWAILNEVSEHVVVDGRKYTAEIWHEHYKAKFIGVEELPMPRGKNLVRPISSTTLDVPAFADYMTQVEADAASMGVLLGEAA
jgi:hypothetical protein